MPRTYAEVRTLVLQKLIDAGIDPGGSANQVFASAEIDAFIPAAITDVSRYKPRQVKDTSLTTAANSFELTLTASIKHKLLAIEALEYDPQAGYRPETYRRNFKRFGDTLYLTLDSAPSAGKSVHLYLNKKHILLEAIGTSDTAGAIKTLAAIGASSLALKSLGTGMINEDVSLTIAGDSTVYTVTSQATIAANEATVSITPVLAAQAAVDAVVTLALPTSTMDTETEELLTDLLAARAAVYKSRSFIGAGQSVSRRSAGEMLNWGTNLERVTLAKLRTLSSPATYKEYSRA